MTAWLLTAEDLAGLLNCSPAHVINMEKGGRMPPSFKVGRLRRWQTEKIQAWIAQGCPHCPKENQEPTEVTP